MRATWQPSKVPSESPIIFAETRAPSALTLSPIGEPTSSPTVAPSKDPTRQPTQYPTSIGETNAPTAPTVLPTGEPTTLPTASPTVGVIPYWVNIYGITDSKLDLIDVVQNANNVFDLVNAPSPDNALLMAFDKETAELNAFSLPWDSNIAAVSQGNYICVTGRNSDDFSVVACFDGSSGQKKWAKVLPWNFYKLVALNINLAGKLEFTMQVTTLSGSGNLFVGELDLDSGEGVSAYSYASLLAPPYLYYINPLYSIPSTDDSCTYVAGATYDDSAQQSTFILKAEKTIAPLADFYQLVDEYSGTHNTNTPLSLLSVSALNSLYVLSLNIKNHGAETAYSISQLKISETNTLTMNSPWPLKTTAALNDMVDISTSEGSTLVVCGTANFPDQPSTPQLFFVELDENGNSLRGLRVKFSKRLECKKLTKAPGGFEFTTKLYDGSTYSMVTGYVDQVTFTSAPLPMGFDSTSADVLSTIIFSLSGLTLKKTSVSSMQEPLVQFSPFLVNEYLESFTGFEPFYISAPSDKPTSPPTVIPSSHPSRRPTVYPSLKPSKSPTVYPSLKPSKSPTVYPSPNPTTPKPTREPTISLKPTEEGYIETENPTGKPTGKPTGEPTSEPTGEPTYEPTGEPTEDPTNEPTGEPTEKPTDEPTDKPTANPTRKPTRKPITVRPSFRPTAPSLAPTRSPSTQSPTSGMPTGFPTEGPTILWIHHDEKSWTAIFIENKGAWAFSGVGFIILIWLLNECKVFSAISKKCSSKKKQCFKQLNLKKNKVTPVLQIMESPVADIESQVINGHQIAPDPQDGLESQKNNEKAIAIEENILEELHNALIKHDVMMEYILLKIKQSTRKDSVTMRKLMKEIKATIKRDAITTEEMVEELTGVINTPGISTDDKLNELFGLYCHVINEISERIDVLDKSNEEFKGEKLTELFRIAVNYFIVKGRIKTAVVKLLSEEEKKNFLRIVPEEGVKEQSGDIQRDVVQEESAPSVERHYSNASLMVSNSLENRMIPKDALWEISSTSSDEEGSALVVPAVTVSASTWDDDAEKYAIEAGDMLEDALVPINAENAGKMLSLDDERWGEVSSASESDDSGPHDIETGDIYRKAEVVLINPPVLATMHAVSTTAFSKGFNRREAPLMAGDSFSPSLI